MRPERLSGTWPDLDSVSEPTVEDRVRSLFDGDPVSERITVECEWQRHPDGRIELVSCAIVARTPADPQPLGDGAGRLYPLDDGKAP